jgi:hypothetical protein
MSTTLADILAGRNMDKPSYLESMEAYMKRTFIGEPFLIKDGPHGITIYMQNGKAAYAVRAGLEHIEAYAAPTKKIFIRVDQSLK